MMRAKLVEGFERGGDPLKTMDVGKDRSENIRIVKGNPKWRILVSLREIFDDFDEYEDVNSFISSITTILEKLQEQLYDGDLGTELDEPEYAAEELSSIIDEFYMCEGGDVEDVDYALNQLYDWGDYHKVWINRYQ